MKTNRIWIRTINRCISVSSHQSKFQDKEIKNRKLNMRLKVSLQQEATWDLLFALFRSLTYEKRVPSSSIKTASFLLPFATNPWFPGPLVFISGTRSFLLLFPRWNPVEFWGFLLDLQKFMHLYPLNFLFFFKFQLQFSKDLSVLKFSSKNWGSGKHGGFGDQMHTDERWKGRISCSEARIL